MTLKRKEDFAILNRMDEKLDNLMTTMAVTCEKVGKLDKTVNGNGQPGHEQRISSMERKMWYYAGGIAVILFLIDIVPKFIGGK